MRNMAIICHSTNNYFKETSMSKKVLVVSFSFQQEPAAFDVLRQAGLSPLLWAAEDRGEESTEQDFINYWNALEEKPQGILMGADVPLTPKFLNGTLVHPKAISLNCAGHDHLDAGALAAAGIKVCNVPRQNFGAVADLAFGLILSLMRKIPQGNNNIRQGNWVNGVQRGMAVCGKTIGIFGMGAVGQAMAKRAAGFDMKIIACSGARPKEVAEKYGVQYVEKEELFRQSDIFVICAPAAPGTYHLVNRQTLSLMKQSAVIINPSRGAVINTQDLIWALQNNVIAGAGLDVFETEPLLESPLFSLENTVLTPHMGGLADREIHNVAMQAAKNMVQLLLEEDCQLCLV